MSGDAESAEALLHSGANVMATDPKGNTPLPLAVGYRGSEASAHRLLQLTGAHALQTHVRLGYGVGWNHGRRALTCAIGLLPLGAATSIRPCK